MIKKIFLAIFILTVIIAGVGAWVYYGSITSNPSNYKLVGDIPTPWGYRRINQDDGFAQYLRSLPLKERGAKVQLFTGGDARFQSLNYAVIDLPLLSNDEQCADMCMRLRAEYLYKENKNVHFNNVGGKRITFDGGSRKSFERYLRRVYGVASTYSLSRELETRKLDDIQPGDVFVYAGVDRGTPLGHAVMVIDVAEDSRGNRVIMIAEGNTPARECHIVRNWFNPFRSPWFSIDKDADLIQFSPFTYKAKELKKW